MATLPRRDCEDLASPAGEPETRPGAGSETDVTEALRSLPQTVVPAPRFATGLREKLLRQADEAARGEDSVRTSAQPE